ncbi:hypothetical protein B7463_g7529, partial [Scytalidium lignicola]
MSPAPPTPSDISCITPSDRSISPATQRENIVVGSRIQQHVVHNSAVDLIDAPAVIPMDKTEHGEEVSLSDQVFRSSMSTTYQYPPYQNHAIKHDANYSSMATSGHSYCELSAQALSSSTRRIAPSLQRPSTITSNSGSIAEFAARPGPTSSPVKRLKPEVIPTDGFRKWVMSILLTTQITPNVILLALLFIYRLKIINPVVKARADSEYRLLTIALMLGNKFLDDNTYTNKTWAEVSGISVTEIHVMEVEFLSNMRYSLLVSKEQWEEWQQKLGKFWTYWHRAPVTVPLPTSVPNPHSPLPSPL